MIGLVLAGGNGTRLNPFTKYINKHLLPVYNKPMIYFSIQALLTYPIKHIKIICKKNDQNAIKIYTNKAFPNINFDYIIQNESLGIVDGIKKAAETSTDDILTILGDNIFLPTLKNKQLDSPNDYNMGDKSCIFITEENNPSAFGVLENKEGVFKIIEKPENPTSKLVVVGLYFIKKSDFPLLYQVDMSSRGEYEITDFNNLLLKKDLLNIKKIPNSVEWIDAGSFENLFLASLKVRELSCI